MLMSTFSFYNEIQISECPLSFNSLQQKIKELYILNERQINNCIFSYLDKNNEIHYIFNDEQYDKALSMIESIIIQIELLDEKTYLSFAPLLYEKSNINKKNNIHYGIRCNLCKKENIEGIRYLCGICDKFNLCQKCEEKNGKEHGHPLLKIRRPEITPKFFEFKLKE